VSMFKPLLEIHI